MFYFKPSLILYSVLEIPPTKAQSSPAGTVASVIFVIIVIAALGMALAIFIFWFM